MGSDHDPQPAVLQTAAALLAFDGGPSALRALERGLEREAAVEYCAEALVAAGPRGAQRLRRRLNDERLGRTAALALAAGGAEDLELLIERLDREPDEELFTALVSADAASMNRVMDLSLIHISEPTRPY